MNKAQTQEKHLILWAWDGNTWTKIVIQDSLTTAEKLLWTKHGGEEAYLCWIPFASDSKFDASVSGCIMNVILANDGFLNLNLAF